MVSFQARNRRQPEQSFVQLVDKHDRVIFELSNRALHQYADPRKGLTQLCSDESRGLKKHQESRQRLLGLCKSIEQVIWRHLDERLKASISLVLEVRECHLGVLPGPLDIPFIWSPDASTAGWGPKLIVLDPVSCIQQYQPAVGITPIDLPNAVGDVVIRRLHRLTIWNLARECPVDSAVVKHHIRIVTYGSVRIVKPDFGSKAQAAQGNEQFEELVQAVISELTHVLSYTGFIQQPQVRDETIEASALISEADHEFCKLKKPHSPRHLGSIVGLTGQWTSAQPLVFHILELEAESLKFGSAANRDLVAVQDTLKVMNYGLGITKAPGLSLVQWDRLQYVCCVHVRSYSVTGQKAKRQEGNS